MNQPANPLPAPPPSAAPGVAVSSLAPLSPLSRRKPGSERGTRRISRHLRAIRMGLTGLILLALLYTIAITKSLLVPLVLAAFIGLALNPIVAAAARWRIPRWLAAVTVMLLLGAGLVTAVTTLSQPALNWFHEAPSAMRAFAPKIKPMTQQIEAASRATQTLVGGAVSRYSPQQPSQFAFNAWDIVSTAPKIIASVLTVALLVFFFLVYGDEILRRAVEISPTFAYKRHTVSIVRSIQVEVSSYLLLTAAINATLGLVTSAMLYLYGVPDPLLWGCFATVANFIPYVGAISTTTVLAVVGALHFQELGPALLPAATFAGITAVEGNMITPMLQGRRSRLSPVAILLWLLIWGWIWGIPGAILAVPMLTCVKLITAKLRGWEWFAHIISR